MRIVVDLQGNQSTGSRNRGIGRYSQALSYHICKHAGEHEIHLLLNGAFSHCITEIRADFSEVLPQERIHVFDINTPSAESDPINNERRLFNIAMREAFIAQLCPDVVIITSLFEGLGDNTITSVNDFNYLPTTVVLYDLIPYINTSPYLENPVVEKWYLHKINQLKRADLLLAISQSSADEAKKYLNFSADNVINISTACDDQFQPLTLSAQNRTHLATTYGLDKPFVMYTGGIDYRKNIERLIEAFAELPKSLRQQYQLAIVCSVNDNERHRLYQLAKDYGLSNTNFIMTGFVPDTDLVLLYNACHLFIFPSWHEGFGLPALEAMQCGRPVIASNCSSLPEVVGLPEALFDPLSVPAITEKIIQGLTDEAFRQRLFNHSTIQAKKFNWDDIAQHTLKSLEDKFEKNIAITPLSSSQPNQSISKSRPSLAYFSPLPPQKSGISDYSLELLLELTRWYDITLIIPDTVLPDIISNKSNGWVLANTTLQTVSWFTQNHQEFERILYQFGNSEFHQHMFELIYKIPGMVVLHDFYLSGIQHYRDVKGGSTHSHAWRQSLYQSHGYQAVLLAENTTYSDEAMWQYPANLPILQSALGVIVHSQNSFTLAEQWYGSQATLNWHLIPHLRTPPLQNDKNLAREILGIAKEDFVICSFGMMGRTKHSLKIVEAFLASTLSQSGNCHLIFVGAEDPSDYGKEITHQITQSNINAHIHITGWVDMTTFRQYLQATDVGIQLRTLSRGETSGTVLDCMNYGVATIVNANGSMQNLPLDSVMMLPDEFNHQQLVTTLEQLYSDKALRLQLGSTAYRTILTQHNPAVCAKQYYKVIENTYQHQQKSLFGLIQKIQQQALSFEPTSTAMSILAKNFPAKPHLNQLLIDVTPFLSQSVSTSQYSRFSNMLKQLLLSPPSGCCVQPIYLSNDIDIQASPASKQYMYAYDFTCEFLGINNRNWSHDRPIDFSNNDVLLRWDSNNISSSYQTLEDYGVKIVTLGFDGTNIHYNELTPSILSKKLEASPINPIGSFDITHTTSQLFIDISELVQHDAHSGIQRVVRAILSQLIKSPPNGYRIEPVYALSNSQGYRYAHTFMEKFIKTDTEQTHRNINSQVPLLIDDMIEYQSGDIFLGLDLQRQVTLSQLDFLQEMKSTGVKVSFVIYDILCIQFPQFFIDGAKAYFEQWLKTVSIFDQLVCISQAVQTDVIAWLALNQHQSKPLNIDYFHLGADIMASIPTVGIPQDGISLLNQLTKGITFLMVGTLEPRKAYEQVVQAFEILWQQNNSEVINLVIVGKKGWNNHSLIDILDNHPERDKQLFWLESVSDEYLNQLYQTANCLITASYGEGFGLPLIEAAQHKLPIIARDIPVFKEVAQDHATYFMDSKRPQIITDCIMQWLTNYSYKQHTTTKNMPYLTWEQSTQQLLSALLLNVPRNNNT